MESASDAAAAEALQPLRRRLLPSLAGNLCPKTSLWRELGGAVGDLGTYIPIALALSLVNGLDLGTTLIFTAIYNAATGVLFGIPMPVQPMKSIAAAAISPSSRLSLPQIMAAGLLTASSLIFLGASGLMSLLYCLLPLSVIRGIQLSQGLSFAFTAVSYIRFNQDLHSGKASGSRPFLGLDGLLLAISALLFILLSSGSGDDHCDNAESQCENSAQRRRIFIPSALLVFLLGLILCFARDPSVIKHLNLGPSSIRPVRITREDWKIGFLRGAIPQIPLSILNSVIAVCKLSGDLFPEQEVSAVAVSLSVGAMNWLGCWFGAMPVCHGAGGLAGQYRFGGRSGLSVVFLAAGKLVLGLVFGGSFVQILKSFPVGILGVLLLFAGVELAMAARDMSSKEESFVMLVCAAVSMKTNAALGFVCGLALFVVLRVRKVNWWSLLCTRRSGGGGGACGGGGRGAAQPSSVSAAVETGV